MSCARLLTVVAVLTVPSAAFSDDLKGILERDKVAIQKVVTDVNFAIMESKTYEKGNPAKAKAVLEKALGQVNNSTVLPDDQRQSLRKRLQTRLAEVNQTIRVQELAAEEAAKKAAALDKIKREQDNAGKNPSAIAGKSIYSAKDQLAAVDKLRQAQAKGFLGVFKELEASATPIEGFVEFPKHWQALTENRAKTVGNKLTDKEVALLKALNSTMSVNFNSAKFREVLDYIQEKTGQAIVVDEGSIKEAMVEYDDPVTFKAPKLTVRTILKKVLADRGLAYVLKDGVIQVYTQQKAREMMVVRTYPVGDLVGPIDQRFGPFINRGLMLQNVQMLINLIQSAVEPTIWNVNGGPGSITFFEPSMSLIVRAPAEMHYMLGGGSLFGR